VDRIGWLDNDRLIVVYSLPTTHVEVIGLDGTVLSSFQPDADVSSGALSGDRLYLGSDDGIISTAIDGTDPRPFPLSIARVRDIVAVTDGPVAAPHPTPHPTPAVPVPTSPSPPQTTETTPTTTSPPPPPAVAGDDPSNQSQDGISTRSVLALGTAAGVAALAATLALGRRRRAAIRR
jgi:hypothetical protein